MFSRDLLTSRDWYDELARIASHPTRCESLVALIETLIARLRIDKSTVIHFPKDEGPSALFTRFTSRDAWSSLEDYFAGNYALDPFYLNLELCRNRSLSSLREVLGEPLRQSEYHKVHYKAAGLIDEICYCCDDKQGGFVVLSLCRSGHRQQFDQQELSAARIIAPIVVSYLATSWPDLVSRRWQTDEVAKISADFHQHVKHARLNFGKSMLTPREFQVLQLLLIGNSVELISHKLDISVETIKVHRKHIYQKLNVRSQAEVFSLFIDVVSSTEYEPNSDSLAIYLKSRDYRGLLSG